MFKDDYKAVFSQVTASQETYRRVMNMPNRKKKPHTARFLGKVLVAAAILSLLAVTASAAERIGIWFTRYFGGTEELSQEQVDFLENNAQKLPTVPAEETDPNAVHTDILQFIADPVKCPVDDNNTHITGQGEPKYFDVDITDIQLSATGAVLRYRPTEEMHWQEPSSMEKLTLVLTSGEMMDLPITDSTHRMYFTAETPIPMDQVDHLILPNGVELQPVNEVNDGFSLSLDSVLTDGSIAYVTLNWTRPEVLPTPGEGWVMNGTPFLAGASWFAPAEQDGPTWDPNINYSMSTKLVDDGDGKETTGKLVLSLSIDGIETPFAPGSQWRLRIAGFEASWDNPKNQALIEEKYAGQDYIIDGEEAAQTFIYTTLCWDNWDFLITFDGDKAENQGELELVETPVTLSGYRLPSIEEHMADPALERVGPFQFELTSFRISPLSYQIEYYGETEDAARSYPTSPYTLRMKDGTELILEPYAGNHRFEKPILLENIAALVLPNGQTITPN